MQSQTGTKQLNGYGMTLTSGSPVWIAAPVTVTNPVNFISFEAQFLSAGSEGLLSVYWNTNELGSLDERVAVSGLHQYTFPLPSFPGDAGLLGFRLDAFSGTNSSVVITNVALGFGGVREPFRLSFTGTQTNGARVLELTGEAGFTYTAESSTNLVDWATIAVLVNTNGSVRFLDSTSTNSPTRFYRALVL